MQRLREVVSDGIPTIILCDNAGQAERLEELLGEGGAVGSRRSWQSVCSMADSSFRRGECSSKVSAFSPITRSSAASGASAARASTPLAHRSSH